MKKLDVPLGYALSTPTLCYIRLFFLRASKHEFYLAIIYILGLYPVVNIDMHIYKD